MNPQSFNPPSYVPPNQQSASPMPVNGTPVSNLTSENRDNPKQSIIDRLNQATNVLITVSSSPSLDQLAACVGFTLFLNKIGKHATAVFSGDVPSAIEFLQPEETLEKSTDSLRDFIISLDKAKADKLRYKVEDNVVKIFITPYKTAISEKDFDFSSGDFNVDAVVALGVHENEDLDRAITAHGRILHDATVISVTNTEGKTIGTLNLQDAKASSLCELMADIAETIDPNSFDAQLATSFLTGIVAETKRFSNEKTSSRTMALSAKLMAAGANQQLVATNLQSVPNTRVKQSGDVAKDGELNIDHSLDEDKHPELEHRVSEASKQVSRRAVVPGPRSPINDVKTEDHGSEAGDFINTASDSTGTTNNSSYPVQPPTMGGTLTANTKPEELNSAVDPLNSQSARPTPNPSQPEDLNEKTLSEIEKTVGSSHVSAQKSSSAPNVVSDEPSTGDQPDLSIARDEVLKAVEQSPVENNPTPTQSIGATPVDLEQATNPSSLSPTQMSQQPAQTNISSTPGVSTQASINPPNDSTASNQPASPPPPVPPPMMPPS